MQTVKLSELPALTKDIDRAEWVANAAIKVVDGEVAYRKYGVMISLDGVMISLDSEMDALLASEKAEKLIADWIKGAECCDVRDKLREMLIFRVESQLQYWADECGIGVV